MRSAPLIVAPLSICLLLLSACASSTDPHTAQSPATSITSAPANLGLEDADSPEGFQIQTDSQWEPTRFHAVWPHSEKATAFNAKLDETIAQKKKDFTEAFSVTDTSSQTAIPEYTTTWTSLLNSSDVVGIRLTSVEFGGASHLSTFATVYGAKDGSAVWEGKDFIAADQADNFLRTVIEEAKHNNVANDEAENVTLPQIMRDASFNTAGDLVIHIAKAELTKADMNDVVLTIASQQNEQWLSDTGKRIKSESAHVVAPQTEKTWDSSTNAEGPDTADSVNCAQEKCIALTFDDGPGPYTNQVLDTLTEHQAKATFFTIGKNVIADPQTVKREVELGMAVGDHTWTHPVLSTLDSASVNSELSKTASAIWNASGKPPFAARPPYGDFTKQTPHAGLPFIIWDIDSEDWKNRNAQMTTDRIMTAAHPGGIVLMHDIHPSTAEALPGIIEKLQSQGYKLVTVPELFDTPLESNGAYYSGTSQSVRD